MTSRILPLIIILASCKTVKDNKAFDRVVNDRKLSEKVFRVLEKENPCVNDTLREFITGPEVVRYDTVNVTDTLEISEAVKVPYPVTKIVTKYVTRVDTLRYSIEDVRRLNLANHDLAIANNSLSEYRQLYTDANHDRNLWRLYFFTLLLACLTYKLRFSIMKQLKHWIK